MIIPIDDRVLIKPNDTAKESNGILIPDKSQKVPNRGVIAAIGEGKPIPDTDRRIPMQCEVGEEVIFQPGAGIPLDIEGVRYLLMHEYQILTAV